MPKYMFKVKYTAEGVKGLLKDGGSKRRQVATDAVKSVGGKMESFYFAFGTTDVFAICEMPDHVTMSAAALAIGSTGAVSVKTVVLITPEEIDQASKKVVTYKAPGQA